MTDSAEPASLGKFPANEATLREMYAAMAMQGIIAGGFADTVPHDDMDAGKSVAHFAVLYADALLAELERGR